MRKQLLAQSLFIAAGALALSGQALAQTAKKNHKAATTTAAPAAPAVAPAHKETPASSAAKEVFSNQGQGYGTAGCGLGEMALGNKPGFMQVFAATTNGTFGSQTFGISSGTSGCGKSANSASMFIQNNRDALAREGARGNGQTLAGLSRIMGCQDTQSFGADVQKHYGDVFGAKVSGPDAIRAQIETLVKQNPSCKVSA